MDLIPDDQQQQISEAARSFVESELPLSRLHRPGPAAAVGNIRQAMAQMGWFAVGLPEADGGVGLSVVEESLILRELGRTVGPTSIIPSLLAAKLAARSGRNDLRDALLSGATAASYAIAEEPLASSSDAICGRARIYDIDDASCSLVIVDNEALLLDTGGEALNAVPFLDSGTPVAVADLSRFPILARGDGRVLQVNGALLTAAMLVGLAEGAVGMINDYAKIRETFGRKIGAYQAVRHPIAEGAARSEHAKALVWFAALAVAEEREDSELQVRAAKVIAHRAATRNADINIQLHGGIGITADLAAHHFMKRALMLAAWFGGRKEHLDAILDAPLLTI